MRREARAAQTDDTGHLDPVDDLGIGQRIRVALFPDSFDGIVLAVIGHDDTVRRHACGSPAMLDRLDFTGYGRVNIGGYKTIRLCDQLPREDLIAALDHRSGRLADMLADRIDHFPLRQQRLKRLVRGQLFVRFGMYTTPEFVAHMFPLFKHTI